MDSAFFGRLRECEAPTRFGEAESEREGITWLRVIERAYDDEYFQRQRYNVAGDPISPKCAIIECTLVIRVSLSRPDSVR